MAGVGWIALNDELVADARGLEARGESAQLRLIVDVQRDGVGVVGEWSGDGAAGSVDELSGLCAERQVGADDAVVRQVGAGLVNASSRAATLARCLILVNIIVLGVRRPAFAVGHTSLTMTRWIWASACPL